MIETSVKNNILHEDMLELVRETPCITDLNNSTVLVTGATGLIGAQIVKALIFCNRVYKTQIRVLAMCRNKQKFEQVFKEYLNDINLNGIFADINNPLDISENIDYIFHGASATSSKYFVDCPVETLLTTFRGTQNVLELALKNNVKGMVYLSSLEVYGIPVTGKENVTENDYGYIDPTKVRSSYSEGKRIAECLCVSYAKEYDVPVKIARLSQTFGAGVDYNDSRVFAEFARCVVENKDIVLHTSGKTIRTYCYTKDAVSALFYIMTLGNVGDAYNVTNEETCVTIYEMAQRVSKLYKDKHVNVIFDIPDDVSKYGYNPEMIICLDTSKLKELGWYPTVDLENMFLRMIKGFA